MALVNAITPSWYGLRAVTASHCPRLKIDTEKSSRAALNQSNELVFYFLHSSVLLYCAW